MQETEAIEVINLTKNYGKAAGIRDVSFTILQDEIFGFIGPNGAGKSTTIRTLLNLIFPTSGIAKIFGLDIVKYSKQIKMFTGYLPAEVNYYHRMTALDLLKYSSSFFRIKEYEKKIKYYSDALGLDLNKNIQDLSSGNKKKVSIVQALLHEPKLLILDEPTSGLDPLIQSTLFEILHEVNKKGTTIFYSSHVLSEVQKISSRVAIIKDGSIIKIVSIEELKNNELKKINIEFSKAIDNFNMSGVKNVEWKGNFMSCVFDGDINNFIAYINQFDLLNITIEDPSLDEVFLHFYLNGN